MVQNVGGVEVEVRANLDPYTKGLRLAEQQAKQFNQNASKELGGLTGATQRMVTALTSFTKSEEVAGRATNQLRDAFAATTASARSMFGILPNLAGVAGLGGIAIAAQQAVQAFGQWEQTQIAFEGRMRATRGILGLTTDEIVQLARTVSRETLTPQENLQNFMLELGRTGQVTTETLQRAARILPDLALRVGDFGRASAILTESLKNPSEAVKLLRDAGIQFSSSQRQLLEDTDTFADRLKNASEVLTTMEGQIGGEAAARGRGVVGGFTALGTAVSELTINLGGAIDRLLGFSEGARRSAEAIEALNKRLFPTGSWEDEIEAAKKKIDELTASLEALRQQAATPIPQPQFPTGPGSILTGPPRVPVGALTIGGPTAQTAAQAQVGGTTDAAEAALAQARIRLEVLELARAYAGADMALQSYQRTQEEQAERVRRILKDAEDRLKNLSGGMTRAQVQAAQALSSEGVNLESPEGRRQQAQLAQTLQAITDRQRQLAQAGRPRIIELENERLEEQIRLFQFSNREMEVNNQLLQVEMRIRRARQTISAEEREDLEFNIRGLRELRRLTGVVESAFTSLFTSMGNALAEFAATGKFDFKQFADSVIRDLVRIATQAFVVQPLMQLVTGITNPALQSALGLGGGTTITNTTGNILSLGARQHGGSFKVPGGGTGDRPYLIGLTPGEYVDVTPRGQRPGSGGNITVINTINSSREFQVEQTEREGPDGQRIMEQTFNEVMRRVGRGEGDNTFGARFGVRPRTVQR